VNVNAEELSALRVGDVVSPLVLPDDDYEDDEASALLARVAFIELREEGCASWAQYLDDGGAPGLRVGRTELMAGLSDEGGVRTVALCLPTSTGAAEWVWLVPVGEWGC
jgi:hypothetical protein